MTVVAMDVGGSKIVAGRYGHAGLADRREVATPIIDGRRDPGSAAARELLGALLSGSPDVTAVGISFCEFVNDGIATSNEVLAWDVQPREWLAESRPDLPVRVESDVRCGAVAEVKCGALRGVRTGYYVSWGTGLSGCAVVGGIPITGHRGRAIALGELPALDSETLERFASGAGIARRHADRAGGSEAGDARRVLAAAAPGSRAATIAQSAGNALAEGLHTVVQLLDPEVVVLGGGLGTADHPAAAALRDRWAAYPDLPPLVVAATGRDSALIGAAITGGWRPS